MGYGPVSLLTSSIAYYSVLLSIAYEPVVSRITKGMSHHQYPIFGIILAEADKDVGLWQWGKEPIAFE
jgi:hypothetical protein